MASSSHCQSSEHPALPVSPAEALAQAYARFKVAGTPAEAVAAREAVLAARENLAAAQSLPIRSLIAQQTQHQKVDAAQEETLAELAEAEREEAEVLAAAIALSFGSEETSCAESEEV